MHRRSFLSMLGLAPVVAVAPALAKAAPSFGVVGEFAGEAILPLSRPLIVGGAITADKIVSGSILSETISIGSVCVGKLKAGDLLIDLDNESV